MTQGWNEIVNTLNNLGTYKQNATLNINKPGIVGSVPNYKVEQTLGRVGNIGKGVTKAGGILGTAVPFYKDFAFPVAKDLYQGFIMGNPEESKALQAALSLAGLDRNGNKVVREKIDNTNNAGNKSVQANGKSGQVSGQVSGQPTAQVQAQALAQQLGGNPPVANKQDADTQQANINTINDYVSKLQEINRPYIDALTTYYNNYPKMLDQQQRAAGYWMGASALTGNPKWAQMANYYNPIQNEANRLSTLKTLQDAQAGDVNAINEVMGNLAMAQEMGLPPEAAFANKNLLTMMAARDREANKYQIAVENNLMKKYGIDRNYARALAVQAMRGQNALDVASMYTNAYGNGGGVAPGLNRQGGVQTPYQPLANKPQGGSNLQQAFDKYANK